MNQAKKRLLAVVAVASAGPLSSCGSAGKPALKTAEGQELPIVFEHEACDLQSGQVERVDVRADGKPGMVRVRSGAQESCRMIDFNHDGVPDTYVYLDEQGRIRRRESDFDRDGKTDEVDTYANGVIVRKDRTTMVDGRFHTWDFYEGGKLHHRLRDSDGDGKVDQWWTWQDPNKIECAVIRTDFNSDGQPEDVVDQCASGGSASSAGPVAGGSASTATTDAGGAAVATLPSAAADAGANSRGAATPSPSTKSPDSASAGAGRSQTDGGASRSAASRGAP